MNFRSLILYGLTRFLFFIQALKSLNLESNRLSPDTLAGLFESIANDNNGIVEIHVSNQAQSNMGSVGFEMLLL